MTWNGAPVCTTRSSPNGDGLPIGFCAWNPENGAMIDALVIPLVAPKPDPKGSGKDG
jgi:hypothetical protein